MLRRPGVVWLAARMVAWRLVLPVLRRILPLVALTRLAWPRRRSRARRPERETLVLRIATRLYSRAWARGDDNCLERSLLAYRFLAQTGADPTLTCGVRRADGDLLGHAWIVVDGRPLAHSDERIDEYTVVTAFGRDGAPRAGTS